MSKENINKEKNSATTFWKRGFPIGIFALSCLGVVAAVLTPLLIKYKNAIKEFDGKVDEAKWSESCKYLIERNESRKYDCLINLSGQSKSGETATDFETNQKVIVNNLREKYTIYSEEGDIHTYFYTLNNKAKQYDSSTSSWTDISKGNTIADTIADTIKEIKDQYTNFTFNGESKTYTREIDVPESQYEYDKMEWKISFSKDYKINKLIIFETKKTSVLGMNIEIDIKTEYIFDNYGVDLQIENWPGDPSSNK